MAIVDGVSGFTQMSRLNLTEQLRIQGVVVQTEGPGARSNWVLVKEKADLPAPVGGISTLNFNVDYEINGNIDMGSDVIEGNGQNVVYGLNAANDRITTNSTSPLFTTTDGRLRLQALALENPSGLIFSINDTGTDNSSFDMSQCRVINVDGVGSLTNVPTVDISDNLFIDPVDGVSFVGSGIIATISNNIIAVLTPGILIDLGTTIFDAVNINSNYLRSDVSTEFINAEADSANITATGQGTVVNNVTIGATPTSTGLSSGDLRWDLLANNTVPDSITSASLFMENNATPTLISLQATDEKVAGTTTFNTVTTRYDMPDDNELRYLGRKTLQLNISYSVSASRTSGSGNRLFTFTIYKNGSPLVGASQTYELDNRERNLTVIASDAANTNDVYTLYVRNEDNDNDVTVANMTLIASP